MSDCLNEATGRIKASYFLSYCHADRQMVLDLHSRLELRLNRSKEFEFESWSDMHVLPGETWLAEIRAALEANWMTLVFVSWNFLSRDFPITEEIPVFLGKKSKYLLPVALSRLPLDGSVVDLAGLDRLQIFQDEHGRAWGELESERDKESFVDALFFSFLRVARKYRRNTFPK